MVALSVFMALAVSAQSGQVLELARVGVVGSTAKSIKQGHYAVSNFHIEVDGHSGGYLFNVDGGYPGYETVSEVGSDGRIYKRPGRTKYSNIVLRTGTGMGKAMYEWIQNSFDKKYERKNGAIVAADFDRKKTSNRLGFGNALLTDIAFPLMARSSKDPAYMSLGISPESVILTKEPTKLEIPNFRASAFQESDFEVVFPDFPDLIVNEVSPINIRFGGASPDGTVSGAEIDNVRMTLMPQGLAAMEKFFAEILRGSTKRTTIVVRYLLPDETVELTLLGVGVASLAQDRDASMGGLASATMEFMVEDFRYKVDHK